MKNIYEITLADILPESLLQDDNFSALAQALSTELKKLSNDLKRALHLPRIDELNGDLLDLLAYDFHVDFYEPYELPDRVKQNLIKNSVLWHRLLGTPAALKLVNDAFNRNVEIKEWYQYGGQPYHFKIETTPFYKLDELNSWLEQLFYVKNVRSWCSLVIKNSGEHNLRVGLAQFHNGKIIVQPPQHYSDTQKIYVGMGQSHEGRIVIQPPFHNPATWQNFCALGQIHYGKIFIRKYPAENINQNLFVRLGQNHKGRIIIRKPPAENINQKLAVTFGQNHEGKITIPSLGKVTFDDDFIKILEPDRTVIIERNNKKKKLLDGDILILYFRFPRRDRWTTIKNPRPDLTRDDIKQLGDYIRDKKALTNIHGEFSSGIFRADLIKTHTTLLF